MRILFVVRSLGAGGAERVLSNMASYWASKDHDITVLTFSGEHPFYKLGDSVKHIDLNLPAPPGKMGENLRKGKIISFARDFFLTLTYYLKLVSGIRKNIKHNVPDAVVSFIDITNIMTILAMSGMKIPLLISERIDPACHPIPALWKKLRLICYPRASALVVQTEKAAEYFPSRIRKITNVIPNPLSVSEKTVQDEILKNEKIIAMGRLCYQKGFDLLLEAFSRIKDKCSCDMEIWGEGDNRKELEALSEKLGLTDRVSFPGRSADAFSVMKKAGIFVLSSRYEGFPNVLLEAMALGLPALSFDCPSGPSEIIRDGENGLLVESGNIDALASAMERLAGDIELRRKLSSNAVKVADEYSPEKIMSLWEALIQKSKAGY